jgi:lauroyl/myristoyl acyltransferase
MSYSGARIVLIIGWYFIIRTKRRSKLGIQNLNNCFPLCSDSRSTTVPVLLCTADHLKQICKTKAKLLGCKDRQFKYVKEIGLS